MQARFFRFFIASPQKPQVVYGASPRYTHTVPLVEPTKYLEKVFADTLTVTQSLKGIYNKGYILNEMSYAFVSGDDVFTINGQKWNFWNPIFQDYEVRMPFNSR